MDKRYIPNPAEGIQQPMAPDYSIPEDQKAGGSYMEPEMFVKQHKTLPHLKGRRFVQPGEAAEGTGPVPGDEQSQPAQTSPEKAEEQKSWQKTSPASILNCQKFHNSWDSRASANKPHTAKAKSRIGLKCRSKTNNIIW